MNITLVSYAKSLDFGIVACRRSLPEIQRMIDYLEDALVELEEVAGLRVRSSKRTATTKSAPRKKSPRTGAQAKRASGKKIPKKDAGATKPKSIPKAKRKGRASKSTATKKPGL